MQRVREAVEFLANLIIRPQRAQYNVSQLIGGNNKRFLVKGQQAVRKDYILPNTEGNNIQLSLYALDEDLQGKPCVIYLHGNCGCRVDANDIVKLLLPENITVCCFDFPGSGLSDGEYITLGAKEPFDLKIIVTFLRSEGIVQIGLWGRSMGAVTALRYVHTQNDLSIAGMFVDSPFTKLTSLIYDIGRTQSIPRFIVGIALYYIKRKIQTQAHFDINDINTLESASHCWIPALIIHGKDDTLIPDYHSKEIVELYSGDAKLMSFSGDHNDQRPQRILRAALIFFKELLKGGIKDTEALFVGSI